MSSDPELFGHDIDFSGLILGFSSAALHYLGEVGSGSDKTSENLALARQNIDIIELLGQKTKGNLTKDEQVLIERVISDLRLKFIEKCK